MSYERLVKRTIFVAECECGERYERVDSAPRELRCKCGKWVKFTEVSYTGPDLPSKTAFRGSDDTSRWVNEEQVKNRVS